MAAWLVVMLLRLHKALTTIAPIASAKPTQCRFHVRRYPKEELDCCTALAARCLAIDRKTRSLNIRGNPVALLLPNEF